MEILKKICGGVLAFTCLVGYITWAENTQENNNMTVIMTFVSAWLLFSKTPKREAKEKRIAELEQELTKLKDEQK